ncbi:MAG: hypothetical protein H7Y17_08575 [Chlorobia bacterium]|nr:hypothetical protein [Fimbriimonadaceae bacterium]
MNAIGLVIGTLLIASPGGPKDDAQAGFEKFEAMVGEWEGANQNGLKIRHKYTLIGNGSVVMEESWFDAHKGDMMVTMYSLHEGKLILTHYCVAKNQPRLVASKIQDKGAKLEFTFMDATGIPNREVGHMDRATYEFISPDRYKTRWTWYQKGKEQWMEEFDLKRIKAGSAFEASAVAPKCCLATGKG